MGAFNYDFYGDGLYDWLKANGWFKISQMQANDVFRGCSGCWDLKETWLSPMGKSYGLCFSDGKLVKVETVSN